jgi:hypothetical protein
MQAAIMTKVCILTPDATYSERWQGDADKFRALLGRGVTFRPWTDAGDMTSFDLVLPLLVWGYPLQSARWYLAVDAWEDQGVRLCNPAATLRWNTDKDYLIDLAEVNIPSVQTIEIHGLNALSLAEARNELRCDTLVVKPSISAGAVRTYRLNPGDAIPFDVLEKEMLVQPVMHSVIEEGEYSLIWFAGHFSHAVLKRPAPGDFRVQPQFGGTDVAVTPPSAAMALGEATIAACPYPIDYARVDMLRGPDGAFVLMELELIEPALFLHHAPDAGAAIVAAIKKRARSGNS